MKKLGTYFLKEREGGRKRADESKEGSESFAQIGDGWNPSLGQKSKRIECNTIQYNMAFSDCNMLINKTKPKALILSLIKHLIWVYLS